MSTKISDDHTDVTATDLEQGNNNNNSINDNLTAPIRKTKKIIYLIASCAALGGLIFGYDIAGAGATFVMTGFTNHFHWTCPPDALVDCIPATSAEINRDKGLINGLFGAGATIGALGNPFFVEKFGRRTAIGISTLVFILGATLQSLAPEMLVMWIGRIFSGMGIGMLSMCVPVYVSEIAEEHIRGMLGTLWQVAVTFGILVASAANLGLQNWSEGWRLSYGGNIIFAIILLLSLPFLPESPRWLAAHGTEQQLYEALRKTRYEDQIDSEMKQLLTEVEEEKELGVATWKEVFSLKHQMRRRLILGISFQAIQQLCGINAIMFYSPNILNTFFTADQAIVGTFILNAINFLATFIALYAIDRVGRVKLLVSGGVIMCISLIANTILASMDQTITVGWCVLAFAAIFIIGFAYSWGPVIWVVCSEMFPFHARGKATGLTTMTNWLCTTLVGALFPMASEASLSACFGFFAVMIIIGINVVYFFQVETANKTSLQIDESYENHKPQLKRKDW